MNFTNANMNIVYSTSPELDMVVFGMTGLTEKQGTDFKVWVIDVHPLTKLTNRVVCNTEGHVDHSTDFRYFDFSRVDDYGNFIVTAVFFSNKGNNFDLKLRCQRNKNSVLLDKLVYPSELST